MMLTFARTLLSVRHPDKPGIPVARTLLSVRRSDKPKRRPDRNLRTGRLFCVTVASELAEAVDRRLKLVAIYLAAPSLPQLLDDVAPLRLTVAGAVDLLGGLDKFEDKLPEPLILD